MDDSSNKSDSKLTELTQRGFKSILTVGPRGIRGLFGWTFFDPANLVTITFMGTAALLAILSMRERGAADWYMPFGLYVALAAFLRGYFFSYYHGSSISRVTTLLVFILGTLATAALWEERVSAREVLRAGGVFTVSEAPGFHFAALLHIAASSAVFIHFLLPRHWLIKMTDQVVETTGLDRSLEQESAKILETRSPKAVRPDRQDDAQS